VPGRRFLGGGTGLLGGRDGGPAAGAHALAGTLGGALGASLAGSVPGLETFLSSGTLLRILKRYGTPQALAADADAATQLARWGRSLLSAAKIEGRRKGDAAECREDSQKPFIGSFLRSSDRGLVMR